jgi:hypothetical protein
MYMCAADFGAPRLHTLASLPTVVVVASVWYCRQRQCIFLWHKAKCHTFVAFSLLEFSIIFAA